MYGEWARVCMESGRGGVWSVGERVYGEWACMKRGVGLYGEMYGEWARGCMESG